MDFLTASFAPFGGIVAVAAQGLDSTDGAHDAAHLVRVWRNVSALVAGSGANFDMELLAAGTILHDCVHVEKDSPLRSRASRLASVKAVRVMGGAGWSSGRLGAMAHAIEAHSFSAEVEPRTPEAEVLQDADRLDSLGAIGVARCFLVSGRMGRAMYDGADPWARRREIDDVAYTLDHFPAKLLRLEDSFRTEAGRGMARQRTQVMRHFLEQFAAEAGF